MGAKDGIWSTGESHQPVGAHEGDEFSKCSEDTEQSPQHGAAGDNHMAHADGQWGFSSIWLAEERAWVGALPQDQELRLRSRCCQVWAITSQGRGGDTAVHRRFTSMIHSVRCFQLLSGSLAPYLVFGVFRHSCSAFSLRSTSSCHSAVLTLILVSFWRLHYTGVPLPEPAGWRHIRHT